MDKIKEAFLAGYFAGHAEAGDDCEEHGKASVADEDDANAAYSSWTTCEYCGLVQHTPECQRP